MMVIRKRKAASLKLVRESESFNQETPTRSLKKRKSKVGKTVL